MTALSHLDCIRSGRSLSTSAAVSIGLKPLIQSSVTPRPTSKVSPTSGVFTPHVFVLGPALPPKLGHVSDLHVLWKNRAIVLVCKATAHDVALRKAASLQIFLKERAFVVIPLHVGHLTLGVLFLLLPREELFVLCLTLFLCEVAPPLNLLALLLHLLDLFSFALDTFQFAELPRRTLRLGIETVRIVHCLGVADLVVIPILLASRPCRGAPLQLLMEQVVRLFLPPRLLLGNPALLGFGCVDGRCGFPLRFGNESGSQQFDRDFVFAAAFLRTAIFCLFVLTGTFSIRALFRLELLLTNLWLRFLRRRLGDHLCMSRG